MSRVTTITLPDGMHRALARAGRRRHESMAAIIRHALDRELSRTTEQPSHLTRASLPSSVRDWLRSPPGSFVHLLGDASQEPTDWDSDATGADRDVD